VIFLNSPVKQFLMGCVIFAQKKIIYLKIGFDDVTLTEVFRLFLYKNRIKRTEDSGFLTEHRCKLNMMII
jgi:hypothetical protein